MSIKKYDIGEKVLFKHDNTLNMGYIESFSYEGYKVIYLDSKRFTRRITIKPKDLNKFDSTNLSTYFNEINIDMFVNKIIMSLQELQLILKGEITSTYRLPKMPHAVNEKHTLKSNYLRKSLELRKDLIKLDKYLNFKLEVL